MYAAMELFIRSVQTMCGGLIWIKTWKQELVDFNPPFESNRSGNAMFILEVTATISTSKGARHSVFAQLRMNGGDSEYRWTPNGSGTCICLDGLESASVEVDVTSHNITLKKNDYRCNRDDFKQKVAQVDWSGLAEQVEAEEQEAWSAR